MILITSTEFPEEPFPDIQCGNPTRSPDMSTSFKTRHPDFASIENHIRRAHAERQVAIASTLAEGIVAAIRGVGRLFGNQAVERTRAGTVVVKATLPRDAARV
jgi:hypothetical protein